ncbi:PH domain-containing protein [Plantactinospora sp. KLBMP9567]|uniref:PH domain-containing protein n=1 Tax=Plantactinospora sp. KLBMP9567 TaxID=3085900 RepID=UPI002982232D|nr:PH domain-containing protein [Plantactinospora sp. KLBMP9567]MDW5323653.1 PH domain-containing protein [Plantactinospora sp. KLBMP9567]
MTPPPEKARDAIPATEVPWRRLDARIIWIDGLYALLSLVPAGLALLVTDEPHASTLIPVLAVAVGGVVGAARDTLRWVKTRYRITEELVEIRTGLLVRRDRALRRERIRTVSTTARLRHRLAGLRVLTVGVGQPGAAGYEALQLDAVTRTAAEELRRELLAGSPQVAAFVGTGADVAGGVGVEAPGERVFARIRWSWLCYNVFSVWALVTAGGLLWGGYWLAQSFGLDGAGFVTGLLDWRALGPWRTGAIAFVGVGALGVLGMAVAFVAENWAFRLVRVDTPTGAVLRTSQGLFRTREVNRDVGRLRGVEISEPLLWRWMGMADTNVISTGLTIWSMTPATTILPRGPIGVARRVAARVLDLDAGTSPFAVPPRRHPLAALRRRIGWATLVTLAVTGLLAWLGGMVEALPSWSWLVGVAVLPLALGGAVVAWRALGHGIVGGYLVVRSGLVSRSTAALARPAVIGWRLRQSGWQRRLGLATLTATTAAGHGQYAAVDMPARTVAAFAEQVVPGLLGTLVADPSVHPSTASILGEECRRVG